MLFNIIRNLLQLLAVMISDVEAVTGEETSVILRSNTAVNLLVIC